MIRIEPADWEDERVRHLINVHINYGNTHYPVESNHHLNADEHSEYDVQLFCALQAEDCLGIGGYKKLDHQTGELKSMHVLDAGRGQGIGKRLMEVILSTAKRQGIKTLYLETGSRDASKAARKLYENLGFSYRPPFGDYVEDPESVFMELSLE